MDTNKHRLGSMPGSLKQFVGVATVFSATCCVALIVLLPLSFLLELPSLGSGDEIDPNGALSIGSLSFAASRGNLWLFTGEYPYRGSIMSLEGWWDGVSVTEQHDLWWGYKRNGLGQVSYIDQAGSAAGVVRHGTFPGIYYRYFSWRSSQHPWWTFSISMVLPIALTALLPIWWLIKRVGANLKPRSAHV